MIKDDEANTLVEMTEQAYDSEDVLQTLLAKYPNLLARDQINSDDPRKWLLITREASLPSHEGGSGRWSVDHLFLDQDGIPTLVEVKRSSDTRIRREVVGQMLDYAANAVIYWGVEHMRAHYEANCAAGNLDPEQQLLDFLDGGCEAEEFWSMAKTNLEAGKIRMVFVSDYVPPELQRIVEFLNSQMNIAEVLAVQIKQYSGKGLKTLVPRVIGLTATATDRKSGGGKRQWDKDSFMEVVGSKGSIDVRPVAERLLTWADENAVLVWWGKGTKEASFVLWLDANDTSYYLLRVSSGYNNPYASVQFYDLKKHAPFSAINKRMELLEQLNTIPDVSLAADSIEKYPSISLSKLANEATMEQFIGILDWILAEIRQG